MANSRDDPQTIPDRVRLFRRINPNWIVYDYNKNEWRPSSQNFQDSQDGTPMSVFAENIATEHEEKPRDFLLGSWSAWFLGAVTAGWMRECGQSVYLDLHNQEPDDVHPSHAAVEGPKPSKHRGKLAKFFEWIEPPERLPPPKS